MGRRQPEVPDVHRVVIDVQNINTVKALIADLQEERDDARLERDAALAQRDECVRLLKRCGTSIRHDADEIRQVIRSFDVEPSV